MSASRLAVVAAVLALVLTVTEGPVIVQASGHGIFRTDYLEK